MYAKGIFKSRNEQLHAEAFATLMLVEDRYFNAPDIDSNNRLAIILDRARNRVYRRWEILHK